MCKINIFYIFKQTFRNLAIFQTDEMDRTFLDWTNFPLYFFIYFESSFHTVECVKFTLKKNQSDPLNLFCMPFLGERGRGIVCVEWRKVSLLRAVRVWNSVSFGALA